MTLPLPDVSVTMLVVDLARLLRRQFEAALNDADSGLTAGEARTLFYVWRYPGQRQAVLAEAMYVEPMTLVGYLDSLEQSGLIRRCPDPGDKRAKLVNLTAEADPFLERIGGALESVRAKALQTVKPRDRDVLERLLQTMKGNLHSDTARGKAR